jgi:hypothetical protein
MHVTSDGGGSGIRQDKYVSCSWILDGAKCQVLCIKSMFSLLTMMNKKAKRRAEA